MKLFHVYPFFLLLLLVSGPSVADNTSAAKPIVANTAIKISGKISHLQGYQFVLETADGVLHAVDATAAIKSGHAGILFEGKQVTLAGRYFKNKDILFAVLIQRSH